MNKHQIAWIVLAFFTVGCNSSKELATIGSVERLDPALDEIISTDAKIEVLGKGYTWSEGPVWVESQKMLLFSDVPADTVYKWTESKGVEFYLAHSGYTGNHPELSREPGANGLVINAKGQLVLCQQGERRMGVMEAPLDKPAANYSSVADHYKGKRFDSPNDAVYDKKGNLYFTDPPYGFKKEDKDSLKEIPFQGVYKVFPNGKVVLLVDSLIRPNGIALSPDEKFLYVSNSDGAKPNTYRYELSDSAVVFGKIFFDFHSGADKDGVPDGMKVDAHGNIFASGPGGIWILNSEGKPLGRLHLVNPTANCAFGEGGKTLYITSKDQLLRVKLK